MAKDHAGHKAMRTTQERRQREAAEDVGIKVRGKRAKSLIHCWDDVYCGRRGNGWKVHRQSQYRPKAA